MNKLRQKSQKKQRCLWIKNFCNLVVEKNEFKAPPDLTFGSCGSGGLLIISRIPKYSKYTAPAYSTILKARAEVINIVESPTVANMVGRKSQIVMPSPAIMPPFRPF